MALTRKGLNYVSNNPMNKLTLRTSMAEVCHLTLACQVQSEACSQFR